MFFHFNGTRVYLCIFPSNGSSTRDTRHLQPKDRPIQDHLIDIFSGDWIYRDYEEIQKLHGEVLGTILKAGKPLFSQLTPSQQPPRRGPASLVPIEYSEGYWGDVLNPVLDPAFEKELDIYGPIPWYTPEDIVVKNVLTQSITTAIAAVRVDGRDTLCKSQSEPSRLQDGPEAREIECLGKILKEYPQQGSIRVPQLLGYIHGKDAKKILGFLRQWVPGRNLREIDLSATVAETKQKWASQIRETVQLLHRLGILIEVGDGLEEGWVGMELMDTTDGDEQGLDRIEKFLSGNDDVFFFS
ncbi:Protein kinase domain-containing protein [Fusarium sp. Ph1]|nr:Protein kinase domain-containing protein [Fusarium sp. Ph1]